MDEAWARIFDMKNSASEERRLREVKEAMEKGIIGRESGKAGKSFTKAEALRQHRKLVDIQREDTLRELVEETPDNYVLVRSIKDLNSMIMDIEDSELIEFDVETYSSEKGGALDPWTGGVEIGRASCRERVERSG